MAQSATNSRSSSVSAEDQPPLIKPYNGPDQRGTYAELAYRGQSLSGYERDSLYLNVRGERFVDISGISGVDSITDGRSIVYGDFDNDGDLDFFVTSIQGETQQLFRNNVGQRSGWVRVVLSGRASGRDAFGAVVRVKYSGGTQTKVKSGGEGFVSQHDPRLLFGLAGDAAAEWVEVTWPSGRKQRFDHVRAGTTMLVTEGEEAFQPLYLHSTQLPDPRPSVSGSRLRAGDPFPSLELKTVAGAPATIPKTGRAMLVNVWATWCAACSAEMPQLEALRPELTRRGVDIIGLNIDESRDAPVRKALQAAGVRYPNFRLDEIDALLDREEARLPLSLLVDPSGTITGVIAGWSPEDRNAVLALGSVTAASKRR